MQKIFYLALVSLLLPIVFSAGTGAQSLDDLCQEPSVRAENSALCREYQETRTQTAENNSIVEFLGEVVSMLLLGLGVASVVAVIIGGLFYITSAGDPQKVTKARNVIIYALVGVAVAVLSQLIIIFVLDRLPADTEEDDQTQTSYVFRV